MATVSPKNASFGSSFNNKPEESTSDNAVKPKAKFWINVGIKIKKSDGTEEFISLPVGIAADTMRRNTIPANKSEYAVKLTKQNQLLDDALSVFESMKPGESQEVVSIVGQFYRMKDEEVTELDETDISQIKWK